MRAFRVSYYHFVIFANLIWEIKKVVIGEKKKVVIGFLVCVSAQQNLIIPRETKSERA